MSNPRTDLEFIVSEAAGKPALAIDVPDGVVRTISPLSFIMPSMLSNQASPISNIGTYAISIVEVEKHIRNGIAKRGLSEA